MPKDVLAALGREFAVIRKRPCVFFVTDPIERPAVARVAAMLDRCGDAPAFDVIINSPGGDPHASYLVAREIGRRCKEVTVFVPFWAKSGATLVSLVGREIVLGRLGELGPIDVQIMEGQQGEFRRSRSCLERFKALDQLRRDAFVTFDLMVRYTLGQEMTLLDACSVAADFTGRLMAPLYSQLKPEKIAESARNLELSEHYAHRILKRYRPDLDEGKREPIVSRLGREYPAHAVAIDLEELQEVGLPAREPSAEEVGIMLKLEDVFTALEGALTFLELCLPAAEVAETGTKEAEVRRIS